MTKFPHTGRFTIGSGKATVLVVAGTRPELLKLAPVVRALRDDEGDGEGHRVSVRTCFSGQHVELLESVLGDVDLQPDIDLRAPVGAMSLSENLAKMMERVEAAVVATCPDGVVVQGDTNTVLAGAMVAHHRRIPAFHVEAGLRTEDRYSPFPEEMNRRLVTQLASLHFAPTTRARDNLLAEGMDPETVLVTGNTSIDSLQIYASQPSPDADAILGRLRPGSRRVLVTLHRRENAEHVSDVTAAVRRLVMSRPDVEVLWILHTNGMRAGIVKALSGHPSVHLLEPQAYRTFVHLMKAAHLILSDSGGVQEEAPSLGKPVLVLRDNTERPEAVDAGAAFLVGCDTRSILDQCHALLDDPARYARVAVPRTLYGDGHAGERIAEALRDWYLPRSARSLRPSQMPPPARASARP